MAVSPFHMFYTARRLDAQDTTTLLPAYASSSVQVYPYQIAAAQFALRSPFLKGCILCDEGSLGKTYEALLIATQRWYEGAEKLLIILPVNIVKQWTDKLESSFTIPYSVVTNAEFEQDGMVITTYDNAVSNYEAIQSIHWDMVIFDEADCLNKAHTGQNKTASILKIATGGAFRLLLTPTPITMSIMDIYGLIYFIDETVLPNADEFYQRYFRKPENYHELTAWVSRFAFRTLKSQAEEYVNFTNRIPYTVSYELTKAERALYEKVEAYLVLPNKAAYPQMERYDLTLMFYHILSSSAQAFLKTLEGAIRRASGDERELLQKIYRLAEKVEINGKTDRLLALLKKSFSRLKNLKLPPKAIVFVDNLTTQNHLFALLTEHGYKVLKYSGGNSRDHQIIHTFRTDKSTQILLATDEAAKGLDMEFCPVVINYDLLYNAIEMEQRINRCHRQGQKSDVLVINLVSKENFSDVRIIELINKRTLQFEGIFGMSDSILGNFDTPIDEVLASLRPATEIQRAFFANLDIHEAENKQLVTHAEDILFTTFTKTIADKVEVTPQYIKEKAAGIQSDLWAITSSFLSERGYIIDEASKTAILPEGAEPPHLFYYWTGSRNRPYTGVRQFGADVDFKPASGRITLASPIGRGVIHNMECADDGAVTVEADIEPCEIGLYCVAYQTNDRQTIHEDYVFVGKTESGAILTHEHCKEIFALPVLKYTEGEHKTASWLKSAGRFHELDRALHEDELAVQYNAKDNPAVAEEIERIKLEALRAKTAASRVLDKLKSEIQKLEAQAENTTDRVAQMQAQKKLRTHQREMMEQEESLFYKTAKVDTDRDEKIAALIVGQKVTCKATRQFVIRVEGK